MAGYIGNKAVNLSTSGADIGGTANLDVVDIDGAVDMASTLAVAGSATFSAPITTIGSAAASTNVELKLNGVASKAQRIAFNEGGTNRWLLGQGAASESSTFELYNAGGVIALSVNRSTNLATFANGISLTDGNLTVASGHGIDFSATGDGAGTDTSELLDDYEEGTFTPSVNRGYDSIGYSLQYGAYTKIGNTVRAYGRVTLAAASTSANSQQFRIIGLPYTIQNQSNTFPVPTGYFNTIASNGTTAFLIGYFNETALYGFTRSSTTVSALTGAGAGTAADVTFTLIYQAA